MKKMKLPIKALFFALIALGFNSQLLFAQIYDTDELPMMRGTTQHIKNGWETDPIFTVGETDNDGTDLSQERYGYRVPGIFDGMFAYQVSSSKIDLLINHELGYDKGYPYTLANGTQLTGARVTKFRILDKSKKRSIKSAKPAYDRIFDRYYNIVTDASQIDEGAHPGTLAGMDRLCSASGAAQNKFGFADDVFFTGEETGEGQEFALDVSQETMYCAPAMGRAAWEGLTVLDNFFSNKVVMLIGDDRGGAPMSLYIGEKNKTFIQGAPKFLRDNGLAKGYRYVWVANNGDLSPQDWNGTGTSRSGKFVRIDIYDAAMAGQAGYDAAGWANQATQDAAVAAVNAFQFSRPEDVATNPVLGTQAVLASTGLSSLYPADSWGTVYKITINPTSLFQAVQGSLDDINNISATISILYDGDDAGGGQFEGPDFGLRSPDNVDWSGDGHIYVNEDRSVSGFCSESGVEASLWQINPDSGDLLRILEMDRNAVPFMQTDAAPQDCGNWESSGTLDVTRFFNTKANETLLLFDVQAHSNNNSTNPDSPIGGSNDLVEGSQLIFATKIVTPLSSLQSDNAGLQVSGDIKAQDENMVIYPNPAKDKLNLLEESAYKIYNSTGALLLEGETTKVINVSTLQPGLYILKTDDGEAHHIIIK